RLPMHKCRRVRCAQQVNVHTILGQVRELRVDYSTGCGPRRAGDYWCLSEPVGRECHVLTAATTGRVYTHTPRRHCEREGARCDQISARSVGPHGHITVVADVEAATVRAITV